MNTHILHIAALLLLLIAAPALSAAGASTGARTTTLPDTPPEGTTAYYELSTRKCFKAGDWAGGKRLLDEGIKKYPQMSAMHELMGKYYLHQAEAGSTTEHPLTSLYDKARYHLIRAISIDEKNVQARQLMLKVETDTKHYSSAIVYCNDLLEENPYNEDLWRKKIDLYRHLGNNAEADRLLERLATIYPADDQLRSDLIDRKEQLAKKQRDSGDYKGQEQTLRELLELNPKNTDYHLALTNLLYRTGRISEAAEAAGHGASATASTEFVAKRASMLCEMNRHREAAVYVKGYLSRTKSSVLAKLLSDIEEEEARAAQYNDAYTAYAKIYDQKHSIEALDYLVNTSIERWYLDDAAMYIEESLKRKGESPKMLYNQYLIQKRLGSTRKANTLLERLYNRYPDDESIVEEMMLQYLDGAKELMDMQQFAEAVPVLEKVYYSSAYPYLKEAAQPRLFTCYQQSHQYGKAEKMLSLVEGSKRITQTAMLYNDWGKPKRALDFLAETYAKCPTTDTDTRNLIASTYEEIALPYVKSLLSEGRVAEAHTLLGEATQICPTSTDLLRYAIAAAQRKGDIDTVARYIVRGRQLYPSDPYFIMKDAQMRHQAGDHKASLQEIAPLLEEYAGDSLLLALYVESSIDIANQYLKQKQPDLALEVIHTALGFAPDHQELYFTEGQAYEQKKEWLLAYESYKKYKPGYAELAEFKRHMEELFHHTLRNTLSLECQLARPGNEDVLSGNAYVNYSHLFGRRSTLYAGLAYAGRDGATRQSDTEMTRGGTGIQLSAGFEYEFTRRFTGKIEAAYATRYFPITMGRLSASYLFNHDWTLSAFASYRMLRSYAGIYGWQKPVVGYNEATGKPIYGDPEYVRTGWNESTKHMWQVGLGVSKELGKFVLSGQVSGLLFAKKYYFNSNVKMQFFPAEGSRSHLFATLGIGSAPESSLIDRSMPVGFNELNSFVGAGGSWFINRWLTLQLSGTWYTMLSQSERLTTTYIANDPYIREDFSNYFYVHASALISF